MKPARTFRSLIAAATALMLLSAPPAAAQTKEQKAAARAAAEAGGDAFDAGKWADAADLFERAERLVHAPPHLLFAARAHAKLGNLVQARELYLALTREELGDSAPRAFKDAQQIGARELVDVEARLPHVSVVVQGAGKLPIRVTRNGDVLATELLGVPVPINPGDYSFQAFADGMESTVTTVKITDGARETVLLTLRPIPGWRPPASDGAESPGNRDGARSGGSGTGSDSSGGGGSGRPLLIGSIASFAVGAVGVGLGLVFFDKYATTRDEASARYINCKSADTCPKGSPEALAIAELDSTRDRQLGMSIGSLAVGGLGLAGGVTLLILDANRTESAAHVMPVFGLNHVGLRGRF